MKSNGLKIVSKKTDTKNVQSLQDIFNNREISSEPINSFDINKIDITKEIKILQNKIKEDDYKNTNKIRQKRDELIQEYIENSNGYNILNIDLLNIKALLNFYRKIFNKSIKLDIKNYPIYEYGNDKKEISTEEKNKLKFFNEKNISIKMTEKNFPHLIGYKKINEYRNEDIINFLKDILYKDSFSEFDFEQSKLENKIKSFHLILKTLKEPLYIFNQNGIKRDSLVKTDLIFVKKYTIKNEKGEFDTKFYHYVSIMKNQNSDDYSINSQHYLNYPQFKKMFILEKAIYNKYI